MAILSLTQPITSQICTGNHSTRLKPASVHCRYTQEDAFEALSSTLYHLSPLSNRGRDLLTHWFLILRAWVTPLFQSYLLELVQQCPSLIIQIAKEFSRLEPVQKMTFCWSLHGQDPILPLGSQHFFLPKSPLRNAPSGMQELPERKKMLLP
jgi:hypothetical protein